MRTPDTKIARQQKIKEILEHKKITSQQQLLQELSKSNLNITQATLSRDLDEIGIVKDSINGAGAYQLTENMTDPEIKNIAASLITGIDHSANIVVVRTPPGGAQFFASSVDKSQMDEIIGTIAGDDTVLIVTKSPNGSADVAEKLWKLTKNKR
jgi:transcriptional regulator of arginine metabolism